MANTRIVMQALPDFPMVKQGDDLAALIIEALERIGLSLENGDILAISSKIVSKSEGRLVDLRSVTPSQRAHQLAEETRKDPRIVELILGESVEIARTAPHVLIVRHRLGFTCANAGIDQSNIGFDSEGTVLLLPEDPDRSARTLQETLSRHYDARIGILISDTHGRPFRLGNLNVAIGLAGIAPLIDQRGEKDLFGRVLQATITPLPDELAAASGLISGQADEGQPVVHIRGVAWTCASSSAQGLVRSAEEDLYR